LENRRFACVSREEFKQVKVVSTELFLEKTKGHNEEKVTMAKTEWTHRPATSVDNTVLQIIILRHVILIYKRN